VNCNFVFKNIACPLGTSEKVCKTEQLHLDNSSSIHCGARACKRSFILSIKRASSLALFVIVIFLDSEKCEPNGLQRNDR